MNGLATGFHITLHARPPGDWPVNIGVVDGVAASTLEIPPSALCHPLPRSFEEAFVSLERLPRFFIEPDGSFVWVGDREDQSTWQLDGMLYDRHGRLLYLELKGDCPFGAFGDFLTSCGGEPSLFVVQLVRHAVVMEATEFARRLAGS